MAAKHCDICKPTATDPDFMCLSYDSSTTVHGGIGRVLMCDVCEQAPAAFTCKADAAALCVACDADIHSANHLARRHYRVPIDPFLGPQKEDVIVMGSWSLLPGFNHKLVETEDLGISEMDPLIDLEYQDGYHVLQHHNLGMESLVPVQIEPATTVPVVNPIHFCQSQSLSHSVSSSSVELSDGISVSDISYPLRGTTVDPSVLICNNEANQVGTMDRVARVLRYREKRKKRKFVKTVRYASRKAYAESRPRIKGRFVKRTQIHNRVDHLCNSAISPSTTTTTTTSHTHYYGIVPSFL
ncbi:hypothetical protein ERO13_D13G215600v2 [Gossypium hirsutum]|uniref:CONSTANS-like 8 protein n=1 Tax=Gossypium hirsutum TaxID=3635 RepID=A0A0D3R2Z0_GOSHI|nr:zinc finger protein CONSTANS-LIKE 5-like [Gossypium hirsutum]AJR28863.1 CONSTANS-like 8 protein [Gossypium hirsutum]AJR28865.1 CONSTANS-like 8 protein [Gossypium hirsutum]AJR28867.1 CONSTANS-like 8 protein [Gossypium hirsutum]AJR28869.1 CONSTANS-like 8 protein [Gossypium hirsutum]ASA69427.1 CONSTANS-like protein [Gossypium hirsutum]